MSRLRLSFSTFLIVLPYVLLSAVIWLEYGPVLELNSLAWRSEFRWLPRAFYFGGAVVGWRAGRPSWFYSWLGFAVWESVIMLSDLAERLPGVLDADGHEVIAEQVGYGLAILALLLYLMAPLWAGWRRPWSLLGAYTVFPHAALTFPLLVSSHRLSFFSLIWVLTMASVGVAAIAALLFWSTPAFPARAGDAVARGVVLYGGVLLAQSTLWVGSDMALQIYDYSGVRELNQSLYLGWPLLSAAVLLPFLARVLVWLFKFSFGRFFRRASRGRPHSDDNSSGQI